jgi:hypothetical protein
MFRIPSLGFYPSNCRNGYSKKTLKGEGELMEIEVPQDREGSFEPQLIRKGQRRFAEFDERIIAMYGRGMTVREIQGFLLDQYKGRSWQLQNGLLGNQPLNPWRKRLRRDKSLTKPFSFLRFCANVFHERHDRNATQPNSYESNGTKRSR